MKLSDKDLIIFQLPPSMDQYFSVAMFHIKGQRRILVRQDKVQAINEYFSPLNEVASYVHAITVECYERYSYGLVLLAQRWTWKI